MKTSLAFHGVMGMASAYKLGSRREGCVLVLLLSAFTSCVEFSRSTSLGMSKEFVGFQNQALGFVSVYWWKGKLVPSAMLKGGQ